LDINFQVLVLESVKPLFYAITSTIPRFLSAIFVLITGIITTRFLRKVIIKSMNRASFEDFCLRSGINNLLKMIYFKSSPQFIIANIFYWVAISFVLMVSLEILGLNDAARIVRSFLLYLPNLLLGVLIFIVGMYLSNLSKKILKDTFQTKNYLLLDKFGIPVVQMSIIFTSLSMALYQIGVSRGLLASIYIILIGSIGLAIFLSFGLASVDVTKGILTRNIILMPSLEEKSSDITPKQHELFIFLKNFYKKNKRSPTIREIQDVLGDKSTKSVSFKLMALKEKGYIKREKGKHRGIIILK